MDAKVQPTPANAAMIEKEKEANRFRREAQVTIRRAAADAGWIYLPGHRVMIAKAHVASVRKTAKGLRVVTSSGGQFPMPGKSLAAFFDTYWSNPIGPTEEQEPPPPPKKPRKPKGGRQSSIFSPRLTSRKP